MDEMKGLKPGSLHSAQHQLSMDASRLSMFAFHVVFAWRSGGLLLMEQLKLSSRASLDWIWSEETPLALFQVLAEP